MNYLSLRKNPTRESTSRLRAYQEAGVQHFVFELSTQSFDSSARTMDTFINKIKPNLNG